MPSINSDLVVAMDSDEENSSVTLSLSKAVGEATQQLWDRSNSKSPTDGRNKQELDSLFFSRGNSIAMGRDGSSMNDGRTVGDGSRKNRSDNAHTTKASREATRAGEPSGRWKSKVGTREGDGGAARGESKAQGTRGTTALGIRAGASRKGSIRNKVKRKIREEK